MEDISPVRPGSQYVEGNDPRAGNVPGFLRPPDEPNHWTRAVWKRRRVRCYKYVDDGLTVEKAKFENAPETTETDIIKKTKRAVPSQNAFRITKAATEAKGMKGSTKKTNLLCVSDATYRAEAFIEDSDGTVIHSAGTPSLKVLGFTFSDKPNVRAHVMTIRKKFRQRYWTLYNLRRNGFTEEELVRVYKTSIRPVADYLDVVYHSLLSDDLDEELDRLQNQALKIIFGSELSGRRLRALAGVTTLRERRVEHCDKFVAKCLDSDRFSGWFPRRGGRRSGRHAGAEPYMEAFACCERLRGSPVYFFRRRLNGKVGKKYGCLLYTSPSPRD